MTRLIVNGAPVEAQVAPRTHLADFLREHLLLTGTHLGCEHGVCGACTLLIDGAPARSCIAFAAACEGAEVTTIEGLEHDPVMVRLRAAFSAEHGLQCGYCTPGMLVTARDIVLRLPDADEARIRLELAGNLCRCTGYAGIVRAISRVLREAFPSPPVGEGQGGGSTPAEYLSPPPLPQPPPTRGEGFSASDADALHQTLRIAAPLADVWAALQNPATIAACVPGATLTRQDADSLDGDLALALGPIQARFSGTARFGFGERTAWVEGEGRDRLGGTRLTARADATVAADGDGTVVSLEVRYTLRGPLAQFARGPVVAAFAAEIADTVGKNLAARLAGTEAPTAKKLGLFRLWLSVLRRWLRG